MGDKGSIVVADDDDDARVLLAGAVRRAGFRIYEANSGGALLACVRLLLARGEPISAVVSDIDMPECNGIAATTRLLEMQSSLRIILMSAFASDFVVQTALEAGAERVLHKPFATSVAIAVLSDESVWRTDR